MAQLQKLPDAHTDFILSLKWDDGVWLLALVAIAAAAVIAVLLYRRRRRHDR